MTARDLAYRAFYSEHPLNAIYQLAHGTWSGGAFTPARSVPLRQLITFAETLPQHVIDSLADEGATP